MRLHPGFLFSTGKTFKSAMVFLPELYDVVVHGLLATIVGECLSLGWARRAVTPYDGRITGLSKGVLIYYISRDS
jgi:hypothetical protein